MIKTIPKLPLLRKPLSRLSRPQRRNQIYAHIYNSSKEAVFFQNLFNLNNLMNQKKNHKKVKLYMKKKIDLQQFKRGHKM